MQSYKNSNTNQIDHFSGSGGPDQAGPGLLSLGIYGNKVANTDTQLVTSIENKPYRTQRLKLRYQIQKLKLASGDVLNCGRKPLGKHVEVHYNPEFNSAKIANVETCGSVWACPVCRNKILTKRAEELITIGNAFRADGGKTCMATFTASHYAGQSLKTVLGTHKSKQGISGAFARLRQHRKWREIIDKIGCVADVRVIETTDGKNGWHVHIHMILYYVDDCEPYVTGGEMERELFDLWKTACIHAGMGEPSREHGIKITYGDDQYLAKWGSPNELTSDSAKQAKNGNKSIAEIEAFILSDIPEEKLYAETRLKEYYNTFFNRKMLTWGGEFNLRKTYLKKPDKTDKEHATDEHGNGERLFVIAYACWKLIYNTGNVGSLLNYIEADKEHGVYKFLEKHKIESTGVHRCVKDIVYDSS